MSLQVCGCCGWSKATTYQGLRIHQGRMGCTPKGASIPEPQQQYMWSFAGQTKADVSYKLDVWNTVKIENTNYYSDMSLQRCHCGWAEMTTYHGLRVHQGKMGCTPKGVRIPKEEQGAWNDCWRPEVDSKKLPAAKKVNMKNEKSSETPSMRNFSDPKAARKVKKENNSASTGLKSRRQLKEHFTPFESSGDNRRAVDCQSYATAPSRIKEEPTSSLVVAPLRRYPYVHNVTSVDTLEDSSFYLQMNPQLEVNSAVRPEQQNRSVDEHPGAPPAVPQEKRDSPLPTPEQGAPKSQLLKEIQNCLEKLKKKRDEKMLNAGRPDSEDVDKSSKISTDSIIKAQSMEKDQSSLPNQQSLSKKLAEKKAAAAEQVKELVRMFSISAAQEKAAGPKEKLRSEHPQVKCLSQRLSAIPVQETKVQSKVEDKKEQSATDETSDLPPTPAEVPQKDHHHDPSTSFEVNKPDISTSMKVKELAQMFSAQEAAVGPKERRGPEWKNGSSQVKFSLQRFLQPTPQEAIVGLKEEQHGRMTLAQKLPGSTCTPTKMKPAAMTAAMHEEHKSSDEASQLSGFSTGPKVKDLARMFSTMTS